MIKSINYQSINKAHNKSVCCNAGSGINHRQLINNWLHF
jgi:hypothetical protein